MAFLTNHHCPPHSTLYQKFHPCLSDIAAMAAFQLLFLMAFWSGIHLASSLTDPNDYAALQSLKDQWKNTPPSWGNSNDPCGAPWEGVTCNNSRVIALGLSTMGLVGKLNGDIGGLTQLRSLDLSLNRGLTGSLSSWVGELQNLNILILAECSFSGNIPDELGSLASLTFLALNSNNFTGTIPPFLGRLINLYWLDLANNQFTGSLPISTFSTPGLDLLLKATCFNFNENQLSGPIPISIFSSTMALRKVLFAGNQLTGSIPSTLGLVQTLEVLQLDRNLLVGKVPSNLSNLMNLNELQLANNRLTGPLPNLTGMNSLNYVDLSNNSFDLSEAPAWFSTLQSLNTLVLEYGSLQGIVPQKLFSSPQLQQVKLRNNAFNGTLNMGNNFSQQLQLVDLENNQISSLTLAAGFRNITLMLSGNPVCSSALLNSTGYCQVQQQKPRANSTSLTDCGNKACQPNAGQRTHSNHNYSMILVLIFVIFIF